jgi:hypothetical protein
MISVNDHAYATAFWNSLHLGTNKTSLRSICSPILFEMAT